MCKQAKWCRMTATGALCNSCAGCTQLYLGEKGITQLTSFESLVNLEVLWVNGNSLKAIRNLDKNIRLKELYAQVYQKVDGGHQWKPHLLALHCIGMLPKTAMIAEPRHVCNHFG